LQLLKKVLLLLKMVLLLLPKMAGSATVAAAKKGVTPVKDGAVAPSKRWLATALLKLLKRMVAMAFL
jgi:hypothetical protein